LSSIIGGIKLLFPITAPMLGKTLPPLRVLRFLPKRSSRSCVLAVAQSSLMEEARAVSVPRPSRSRGWGFGPTGPTGWRALDWLELLLH